MKNTDADTNEKGETNFFPNIVIAALIIMMFFVGPFMKEKYRKTPEFRIKSLFSHALEMRNAFQVYHDVLGSYPIKAESIFIESAFRQSDGNSSSKAYAGIWDGPYVKGIELNENNQILLDWLGDGIEGIITTSGSFPDTRIYYVLNGVDIATTEGIYEICESSKEFIAATRNEKHLCSIVDLSPSPEYSIILPIDNKKSFALFLGRYKDLVTAG